MLNLNLLKKKCQEINKTIKKCKLFTFLKQKRNKTALKNKAVFNKKNWF